MKQIYACNMNFPKSKRWFTAKLDETLGSQYVPDKKLSRTESLKLSKDFDEGKLEYVPHGYGCTSFWEYKVS